MARKGLFPIRQIKLPEIFLYRDGTFPKKSDWVHV